MTVRDSIILLNQKLNRNNTNQNTNIDTPRATNLLNEAQNQVAVYVIRNERNSDNLDIVNALLRTKSINRTKKENLTQYFKVPENFIRIESVEGIGRKNGCEAKLRAIPVKTRNKSIYNTNKNYKSNWFFRDTFYTIAEESIKFEADFDITKLNVEYYREPRRISVAGWQQADGTTSQDVEWEFGDSFIHKVIDAAARNFLQLNNTNT